MKVLLLLINGQSMIANRKQKKRERQKSNSAEKKYLQHQKIDTVEFIKFIVTLCVTLL